MQSNLPPVLRIEAVTGSPRHEAIARISQAIQAAGGYVIEFKFFSNTAFFINCEVKATRMAGLRTALEIAGVRLTTKCIASLDQYCGSAGAESETLPCHLFVTFVHNDPDLRIPSPAVPG